MQHKMGFPPRARIPDVVRLVASRWTAAKRGAIGSLWPAVPRRVTRYVGEMLVAHAHSLARKTYPF